MAKQLEGKDSASFEFEPIKLGLPTIKELGARWLVTAAEYISNNPQIIVYRFLRSGISRALDENGGY